MTTETKAPANVQIFQLRTALLSEGRTHRVLASAQSGEREMNVAIKSYAGGGENEFHAHMDEDHTFIILTGRATFQQLDGPEVTLERNGGILIPAGAYYKFEAIGPEPLVLMRVGNKWQPTHDSGVRRSQESRLGKDGAVLDGHSKENKYVKGVPIEGAFYE